MAEQGATYHSEIFPIRQWIRSHYKKIRGIHSKCNHCSKPISFNRPSSLLNHLVQEHSNKLTEEEKKDKRTHWAWDHLTIIDKQYAKCNICGRKLICDKKRSISGIRKHLQKMHGTSAPRPDDMGNVSSDANTDTTIKKDQVHSATSFKICKKNTEQIDVLDKYVADHILDLPLRRDVENHDLDLSIHKDIDIAECLSFPSQSSCTAFFEIEFCDY